MQVTEPALTASGIAVRYGRRAVLDGAALDLHRGEVVAVVGENGSGKTTLLRVCAGLLTPDAGRVERAGRVGSARRIPRWSTCSRPTSTSSCSGALSA